MAIFAVRVYDGSPLAIIVFHFGYGQEKNYGLGIMELWNFKIENMEHGKEEFCACNEVS